MALSSVLPSVAAERTVVSENAVEPVAGDNATPMTNAIFPTVFEFGIRVYVNVGCQDAQ